MRKGPQAGFSRREVLKMSGAALGVGLFAPMVNRNRYRLFADVPTEYSARTVRLMEETTVFELLHLGGAGEGLADPRRFTEEDHQKFVDSNINVFHITVSSGEHDAGVLAMARWNGLIAHHSDKFVRVTSIQDVETVEATGRIGIICGFQNSDHFRTVEDVDLFQGLGQRISQLTYNSQNRLGTGAMDRHDGGLSDYGADIVQRMNQVGMAVDVGHCGDRTSLDTFEVSSRPVLITHSNVRALVPGYRRNTTDEMLRAMAATGGMIGLTSVRSFVRDREPTTIEHLIDHYDHVRDLIGVEFVGIGSDHSWEGYDHGNPDAPQRLGGRYRDLYHWRHRIDMDEMTHPRRTYEIVEGLVRRGWSDDEIRLAIGGNARRVLGGIWSV